MIPTAMIQLQDARVSLFYEGQKDTGSRALML